MNDKLKNYKEAQSNKSSKVIDNTIEDSFPASDPPSWTGTVAEKGNKDSE